MDKQDRPKPQLKSQRDLQTVSLFLILGVLTVMALIAMRWVLFVPVGQLVPNAVESSKSP